MMNSSIDDGLEPGYATIYVLIVLGAAFLALSLSASEYAIQSSVIARDTAAAHRSQYALESCVELALLSIYANSSDPQSGSYEVSGVEQCNYQINQVESGYEIVARDTTSELLVEVGIIDNILVIDSWN